MESARDKSIPAVKYASRLSFPTGVENLEAVESATQGDLRSTRDLQSHPMHILVLTMYYSPDQAGIAPLAAELCEDLVRRGHQVSVLTAFPHYPNWQVADAYKGKFRSHEILNGVSVHRGYVYVPRRRTTLRRVLYDTSMSFSALLGGLKIKNVDMVLSISTPLQLGISGWLLSRIKRVPFILQVKDLLPDLAIALGMLKNPFAIRFAKTMERFIYRRARAILVICRGFADNLKLKGVPEEKVRILPDWVDTDFIRPGERNNSFRHEHAIPERDFIVLHAGTMGAKHRLENVIDAASLLRGRDVRFVLAGDGSEKPKLEAYAREKGLTNLRFLPLQEKQKLPGMLAAADVLILNQAASIIDMVIPSKLLTYMASGRPVVAAVESHSEVAKTISEAGCGLVVAPEDSQALAQAITAFRDNPQLGRQLGARGQLFAEEHFARSRILQEYDSFLRGFLGNS